MDRPDEFFMVTLKLEGRYSNRLADLGGETKFGITQRTLSHWLMIHELTSRKVATLEEYQAKEIYMEFYYLAVKPIDDIEIHFNYVDMAYNSGYGNYIRLKDALGKNPLIEAVYDWRTQYFKSLNQPLNINGWLNRLAKIRNYFNPGKITDARQS